jgi:hypothetical protein
MDHEFLAVSRGKGLCHRGRSHEDDRRSTGRTATAAAAAVRPSIVFLALASSVVVCVKLSIAWLMVAVLMAAFVIGRLLVCPAITLVGEASGSARRLLRHRPRPPDPRERYMIDPQFVLRAVERAS